MVKGPVHVDVMSRLRHVIDMPHSKTPIVRSMYSTCLDHAATFFSATSVSSQQEDLALPGLRTNTGNQFVNLLMHDPERAHCFPMLSPMLTLLESPKTLRGRQRVSMRKDGRSKQLIRATVKAEQNPGHGCAWTSMWFVTEVPHCPRMSIDGLQIALAHLAGAQAEIYNQPPITTSQWATSAIRIAGIPQHTCDALPGMDWLGSKFTPSLLVDLHGTFLVSLMLASKFSLDKVFPNKVWAK
ncbi:hypothetical protein FRC10_011436 [Ceratobasidium sp. 414]|nr:hypothetical protein FRC10_011436 [Ceratobasidium sp. 414]